MTLPSPSPDPMCRYRVGPEPGRRAELVATLARLLIGSRERGGDGEVKRGGPTEAEAEEGER